ncbi:hypothetical protein [Paraglaciecola hydrolytica]|uniref:Uncharacterized protein n=1 Tax=Paraglaciecola hydrolytica TaxID=1799789 RepID=A0A136A3M0_9ALTE|nr:hypothetical protein [Paraglaciecola hydrolytica]KXI29814.1 hypothetical protein AX660_07220 [Paraglaciecola hydrolytica]
MSELSPFLSQGIIVPVTGLRRVTKQHTGLGNSAILTAVFPQLAITPSLDNKALHFLKPADDFMLQETAELLSQLQQKCHDLGIEGDEFKLNLQGQKIAANCNLAQHQQLTLCLHQDKSFMDKFSWLQPNYLALANSLEWLNFADTYEVSRTQACQRFVHLQQNDHGLVCYFSLQKRHVEFIIESPINLFKVAGI